MLRTIVSQPNAARQAWQIRLRISALWCLGSWASKVVFTVQVCSAQKAEVRSCTNLMVLFPSCIAAILINVVVQLQATTVTAVIFVSTRITSILLNYHGQQPATTTTMNRHYYKYCISSRTLNYGSYGIFLTSMGNAGCTSSTFSP